MKKTTNIYQLLLAITGIFLLSGLYSCKKLLEVKPSGSTLITSNVFTDSVTVQSALASMYLNTIYRAATSTYPAFSADEFGYAGTNFDAYINNSILTTDDNANTMWTASYNVIYNANSIIQGLNANKSLSPGFLRQALGEAYFMRAFCYFKLVNLYGDVPLILGTNLKQNSVTARTPAATVYAQIIADLKFAQNSLAADYSASSGDRTRANKLIATAMLAKVSLYMGNWADAEVQATAIINNTALYSLQNDLTKVFAPSNNEAIWQFYNDATGYTTYAFTVLPNVNTPVPTYILTPSLVNAFEPGDKRKAAWTATITYNGSTYTYPAKYKSLEDGANAEYFTVLRLAEIYLIRAEARAEQNNITGAITDLNMIRNPVRVGLPVYNGSADQASVLSAIIKERRIELFGENGNRWFDLKRTGQANTVIGALKPAYWKPDAALYPIPAEQISTNPNLKQNPGYTN